MASDNNNNSTYTFKYFNVTFPREYVAHVEINRAEKMNAFMEAYV
jgi:delta(3,5)-delta(2,4)-dienoyl-CoA isomerase